MPTATMHPLLSLWAAFCAVQVASFSICLALVLWDGGPAAISDGVYVWITGQILILPFIFFSAAPLLLLRMLMGLAFTPSRRVAVFAGIVGGAVVAMFAEIWIVDGGIEQMTVILLGAFGGRVAGEVWWRVERRWIEEHVL